MRIWTKLANMIREDCILCLTFADDTAVMTWNSNANTASTHLQENLIIIIKQHSKRKSEVKETKSSAMRKDKWLVYSLLWITINWFSKIKLNILPYSLKRDK